MHVLHDSMWRKIKKILQNILETKQDLILGRMEYIFFWEKFTGGPRTWYGMPSRSLYTQNASFRSLNLVPGLINI